METVLYIYMGLITLGTGLLGVAIASFVSQMRFLKDEIARIDEDIKELERKADEPFQKGEIKDRERAEQQIEKFKEERKDKALTKEELSPVNVVVLPAGSFLLGIGASIYGILKYQKLGPVSIALTYWQISLGLIISGVLMFINAYRSMWKSAAGRKPERSTEKARASILSS